jgi:hypothetical protein
MLYNKTGNSRRNLPLSDEWEDAHWNLELCRIAFIFRPLDDLNALDLYDMNSLLDTFIILFFLFD